ncbi:putative pre-mRNA-splicing factor 38 [Rosa chinensis]|uniref:Pre-mRNA-splicing factor 38 n=1 Tax=Rosa chinensis TaxID=74649 RepID=A0A2P6P9Y5_ROSCH|nr:putative pre-mRNA-splicing factor 38 [Rosa chinensis]
MNGTKPENLLPNIVRTKIQDMRYWKEHCFGLTAESLLEKAIELDRIGGTFGGN